MRARVVGYELLVAGLLACCCFESCDTGTESADNGACASAARASSTTRGPGVRGSGASGAVDAPTISDLTDTITSRRAIAARCGPAVTFLDPATGARAETITPVAPSSGTVISIVNVILLDVDNDTLVVFLYHVEYRQDGLTPAHSERRVQVHSRGTGQRVLDTAVLLPGEQTATGRWPITAVAGTDPRGYVALNLEPTGSRDVSFVLAARPGLTSWSMVQDHPSLSDPSTRALAVHNGVLLTSRVAEDVAELHGYDITTGGQLWRRRYGVESLTVPKHPGCAIPKGDTFVVTGRWVPLAVDVRTGVTRAPVTHSVCMRFDPLGPTGAHGGSGYGGALIVVDLNTGKQRWTVERERSEALGLRLVSVYANRVYVTTRDQTRGQVRLVLDAATGNEIARDWKLAPVERHDGWIVAYDPIRDRNVVIRG
jgi:outer membrane protein assembly factor BamB